MADAYLCPQIDYSKLPERAAPLSGDIIPRLVRTFRDAADSYVRHGGDGRFLQSIVDYFGDRSLQEIAPFDVKEMARILYPHQTNATVNRQALTPARAVLNHAYDRGWSHLHRIRNFRQETPKRKKAASQAWLHAFIRQCEHDKIPHMAGLVMFMSQTGARVSEAIELRWREVDMIGRTALLLKTKTDRNSTRFLTDQMIGRLHKLAEGRGPEDRVFRFSCRHSVNERIKAVCGRAGISYKPSHTCGRHAFANNALSLGLDIKSTMDAGGWKSTTVFLGTYVNPRNAGRVVAERMNLYQYESDL